MAIVNSYVRLPEGMFGHWFSQHVSRKTSSLKLKLNPQVTHLPKSSHFLKFTMLGPRIIKLSWFINSYKKYKYHKRNIHFIHPLSYRFGAPLCRRLGFPRLRNQKSFSELRQHPTPSRGGWPTPLKSIKVSLFPTFFLKNRMHVPNHETRCCISMANHG